MRFLMVAPGTVPVPGSGSVEICMLSIAKELAVKGHRVTILYRTSQGKSRRRRIDGVAVVGLSSQPDKSYISSVLEYLNGKKFDYIQVDNRPHYMAKVKKHVPGTKVSLFLHSLTFVPKSNKVKNSMQAADIIIANSKSLKNRLASRFPKTKTKLRMVHLGVDTNRFKPIPDDRKRRLKKRYHAGKGFTILFAGRIIPRKGVPVLIKAVRLVRDKIPTCRLVVVGRGKKPYIQSLRTLADRLNVSSRFLGKIPHDSMHRVFGMADCFVCPSQRHEAFGLVNVEAMASGVPVVASNIGGLKEIVKHDNNGFLVKDYKNPKEFAKLLIRIGTEPMLAKRLSKAGREDALAKFSWRQTAGKLIAVYQEQQSNTFQGKFSTTGGDDVPT